MPDLVVIVPSRGRPEAVDELNDAFRDTCTARTRLMVCVDEDDPTLDDYLRIPGLGMCTTDSHSMVESLNIATGILYDPEGAPFAVGFMGDDHRPRTKGWDERYLASLHRLGTGIVYGNDLFQGRNLPTQVAMTSDIVRALGYMAPPVLTHLFVDDFWRDLGLAVGCIRYLPDVIVEHMHPLAGKAAWSEGHRRVNTKEMGQRDQDAYRRFVETDFADAVAKVKALRP